MTGRAPEVDQSMKAGQVERRYDFGRTQDAETMHPHDKGAQVLFSAKKVIEDRTRCAEGLLPSVRAFPHGFFEMSPHRIERPVRIQNVANHGMRAVFAEVGVGNGLVVVRLAALLEKGQA